MTRSALRPLVLKHLANPLAPVRVAASHPIHKLITPHTTDLTSKGGLSPIGAEMFKDDVEVMDASKKHMEGTRIQIREVLITCALFLKQQQQELSEKEQAILATGIQITGPDGKPDAIQTTRKNGKMFTPVFKTMMSNLFTLLKKDHPQAGTTLSSAALIQQKAEMLEKQSRDAVSEMA